MNTQDVSRGPRLEFLTASVFQAQGYLVRRGIPLKYDVSASDATDVDIIGIRFTPPFQRQLILCDCKDKQRSKPYERIFWAKGLAGFVSASEVYVALPRASLDIINFAKKGDVRVLTQDILAEHLDIMRSDGSVIYGVADSAFASTENRINDLIKNDKQASDILKDAQSLYLKTDPFVATNIAMGHLERCSRKLKGLTTTDDQFFLWRYLVAELTVILSLQLVSVISETVGISKTNRSEYIIERLTFGEISPKKAKEIFSSVKEISEQAMKSMNPSQTQMGLAPFDLGDIESPHYAANFAGLVERAINSPHLYHELPQRIDYLVFGQSLQHGIFSDEKYRAAFPGQHQDEKLKVARNIFAFLRDSVQLSPGVFWPNQSTSDSIIPR